jgi:hypothetical protein
MMAYMATVVRPQLDSPAGGRLHVSPRAVVSRMTRSAAKRMCSVGRGCPAIGDQQGQGRRSAISRKCCRTVVRSGPLTNQPGNTGSFFRRRRQRPRVGDEASWTNPFVSGLGVTIGL